MDRWPQRTRFKELVAHYRQARKVTRAVVAQALGIAESTLHNYLYNRSMAPSAAVLQRAAKLFGVSVTELLDDPGMALRGLKAKDLSGLGELDRAILREVARDLGRLKEPQKQTALDLWRAGVRAVSGKR